MTILQGWFDYYNHTFFRGRLPHVQVTWKPVRGHDAIAIWWDDGSISIHIHPKHRRSMWVWRWLLIHEMAHVEAGTVRHCVRFKRVMKRLSRAGAFVSLQ